MVILRREDRIFRASPALSLEIAGEAAKFSVSMGQENVRNKAVLIAIGVN
jgi:hypothetical protein